MVNKKNKKDREASPQEIEIEEIGKTDKDDKQDSAKQRIIRGFGIMGDKIKKGLIEFGNRQNPEYTKTPKKTKKNHRKKAPSKAQNEQKIKPKSKNNAPIEVKIYIGSTEAKE